MKIEREERENHQKEKKESIEEEEEGENLSRRDISKAAIQRKFIEGDS